MNFELKKESILSFLDMEPADPEEIEQGLALIPQLDSSIKAFNRLRASTLFALSQSDSVPRDLRLIFSFLWGLKRRGELNEDPAHKTKVQHSASGESHVVNETTGEIVFRSQIDPGLLVNK